MEIFFFSSRRRHTRLQGDWSSDVCSSDLLVDWLNRAIPRSVVRGLQLALGLSLCMKGLGMVVGTGGWIAPDGYVTAIAAALVVLFFASSAAMPAALVLFVAGIALAAWKDP